MDYPVVSGNVSLYNDTKGRSILPTPVIGGVGIINDLSNVIGLRLGINDNIYIVQPDRKSYEAPNLVSLLNDEKILKIFHFARMDVHFLEYYLKTEVKNYYCTKLMSKLARSYSSNHGLKDLCQELCNVKLEKKYGSSTDWNKSLDDVSEKELKYLCNDVLYLKEIKEKLQKMLQRDNRFDLFLSSMNGVRSRINLDKAGFNDPNIFEH